MKIKGAENISSRIHLIYHLLVVEVMVSYLLRQVNHLTIKVLVQLDTW
jgi:hypothetical protein